MPRLRFVLLIPILAVRCDAADPAPPDALGLPATGPVTDTVAPGDRDDDPAPGEPEPPAPSDASCAGLPVVPCAFGFGMDTRAAYGGDAPPTIYRVTTLDDASPAPTGSLREAVEAPEPRVVVFEISGTIRLVKELEVRTPYLTLAGQTAPSPGILIRDYGFAIYSHDVLMQHVRIRPGWDPAVQNCNVGVYTYFTDDGALNAHDLVFDHLSVGG